MTAWVYNTLGYNECPEQEWDQLTEDTVDELYGSIGANLNGPRHWTLDGIGGSGASTTG